MLIGVMSDSHGDAEASAKAVELLTRLGAEKLVHCGDICDIAVLDELAGRDAVFVWGNCDEPNASMRRYVAAIELPWPTVPVIFEADGKRFAVFHGHERGFGAAARSGEFDVIFYGHTHSYADHREGGCRLINPGALYRARVHTVAVLDTGTDELRFYDVESGEPLDGV